jgi:hypothetical protein
MTIIDIPTAVSLFHEAGLTDVTTKQVQGWCDRGKLQSIKIGGKRRLLRSDVTSKIKDWENSLGSKPPGRGWTLSPEAKKDIEEINRHTHWG